MWLQKKIVFFFVVVVLVFVVVVVIVLVVVNQEWQWLGCSRSMLSQALKTIAIKKNFAINEACNQNIPWQT